jgi:hypothetical protein
MGVVLGERQLSLQQLLSDGISKVGCAMLNSAQENPSIPCVTPWPQPLKHTSACNPRQPRDITMHCNTSHDITLHYIASHKITLRNITLHYTTSPYITLLHNTLLYLTLQYITSHQITPHHITPHHITSHHITSPHITFRYPTLHSVRRTHDAHHHSGLACALNDPTSPTLTVTSLTSHYVKLHCVTLSFVTSRRLVLS